MCGPQAGGFRVNSSSIVQHITNNTGSPCLLSNPGARDVRGGVREVSICKASCEPGRLIHLTDLGERAGVENRDRGAGAGDQAIRRQSAEGAQNDLRGGVDALGEARNGVFAALC